MKTKCSDLLKHGLYEAETGDSIWVDTFILQHRL